MYYITKTTSCSINRYKLFVLSFINKISVYYLFFSLYFTFYFQHLAYGIVIYDDK